MKKISIDLDEIGSATRVGEDERENQEIKMWAADLSSAVISSDFPLVLFVRHRVDGRKRRGREGGWSVSLHWEEYQLLEIQKGKRA